MHESRLFGFAATLCFLAGCNSDSMTIGGGGTDASATSDASEDAGRDAEPDANMRCDAGPIEGWNCPNYFPPDVVRLCETNPFRIRVDDNGSTRNITFNAGPGAWGCCYDTSAALVGQHIRDDVYHSCWGPNGEASNETSLGAGCWIALTSGFEVNCDADSGTPDAEPTDAGPSD